MPTTALDEMKVAVVSDDMKTVSAHFGMARHYVVYEVKSGKIVGKEVRDKQGHGAGTHEHHRDGQATPEMTNLHDSMLSNVSDCEVLIARGMGWPMYTSIKDEGKRAYITQIQDADEAVKELLAGRLDDHPELLH
jgi:predicted Fe-Mo cluster-binding NifX family protein